MYEIWVTILQYEGVWLVLILWLSLLLYWWCLYCSSVSDCTRMHTLQRLLLQPMQDRYTSCIGITKLLHLSCNGHETFDQTSFCVRVRGCDTCMLFSGHFRSFLMGCSNTPCNIMVLLRLGTHVVAWTGRFMQCTVTACTLLWLVATRNTAHTALFGDNMLFKLGRGSTQLTECSWADKLQLSWQLSLPLQLSWQVAAELT